MAYTVQYFNAHLYFFMTHKTKIALEKLVTRYFLPESLKTIKAMQII